MPIAQLGGGGTAPKKPTVPDPYEYAGLPGNLDYGGRTPSDATAAGYTFDPVQNQYLKSPSQRGTETGEALKALMAATGFSGGASGPAAPAPASISFPDTAGANAATFARGKDQAAQNARASLTALTESLAGRNMLGGGVEAAGIGEVVGRAGGGVNELIREQTIQDVESANQRAAQEYQGRITQRGQDINVAQADADRKMQVLQGLLGLIQGGGTLY